MSNPPRLFPRWICRLLFVAVAPVLLLQAQPQPTPAVVTEEERQAREVLVRWVNAIGGASEVQRLKTGYIQSTIDYGNGSPPIELLVRAAPGGYRMEYKTPAYGTVVQAFNGRTAWQHNEMLGFGFLSAQEHGLNVIMSDFRAPLRVGSWFPRRKILPEETIDGRKLRPVLLGTENGREEKWYFDPATGHRVRMEFAGATGPVILEFDDFRAAIGARVKEAYRVTRTEGSNRTVITLRVVLYNEEMDALLFSPPLGPAEDNARLESLLRTNASIVGIEAIRAVQTRVTEQLVQITTSGMDIPTRIYQKRPNLLLIEQVAPGTGRSWRGYDGKVGWAWSELEGYREMQGPELQQMLAGTDLDGPLKISLHCPLRRFFDDKTENGRHLIGVAMASLRGPEGNFYFDRQNGELVQLETFVQTGPNGTLKIVADFSDYRRVDGMLLAHTVVITNPAMRIVTRTKWVKHNVALEDAFFAPRKEP
jgi:hypothetical protein